MNETGKNLVIFMSHLDVFEFSSMGFVMRHKNKYDQIRLVVATSWNQKEQVAEENLAIFVNAIGRDIEYTNLNFEQRTLGQWSDAVRDKFFSHIDFNKNFDLVSHDADDVHTDHRIVNECCLGLYKHANNFLTVYSPSSVNFRPNYYIKLTEKEFKLKKRLFQNYDVNKEQSYSKRGNYFDDKYLNLGSSHLMENFANERSDYCEMYRILKWVE